MKALILATIFMGTVAANAQQPAIRPLLQAAAMGKTEEIRKKLPDLLAEYPDDAGVQYLHASIIEDAAKAVPLFEKIVKNYPNSEWADDAEWRVVQYYAMKRDTVRARTELTSFRTKYPQSEFLLAAADAVKFSVGLSAHADKQTPTAKETAVAGAGTAKSSAKNTPAAIATKAKVAASDKKIVNKSLASVAKNTTAKADAVVANAPKTTVKTAAKDKKEVTVAVQSGSKSKSDDKSIATNARKATTNPVLEKAQSPVGAFPAAAPSEKTNPDEIEAATFEKEDNETTFSLQVGSYATKEQAENEVKNFHNKRLRASVEEKNVQGTTKYAVFIGEYASRSDAEKARVIVEKQCACRPFIVTR
ncbi:MAG: SPOR domain-containing protein [Bacteroidetes bacterium]|nr:SPOR domain-containing protein [Bacteroidota bacterium]